MKGLNLNKEERIAAIKEEWADAVERIPESKTDRWPNQAANAPYKELEKKYKAKMQAVIEE